jgi:frataxin-like iron-binding protein CyaY
MNATEKAYVDLGRKLITLCENNKLFNGQDEESLTLWNAAVTAGNKFISFGTTWTRFKSHEDLSAIEKKAVRKYLDGEV